MVVFMIRSTIECIRAKWSNKPAKKKQSAAEQGMPRHPKESTDDQALLCHNIEAICRNIEARCRGIEAEKLVCHGIGTPCPTSNEKLESFKH